MFPLFLISLLFLPGQPHTFRPLTVYTQNLTQGSLAVQYLATKFNVRLHPTDFSSCDTLVEVAKRDHGDKLLLSSDSTCGQGQKRAQLMNPDSSDFTWSSMVQKLDESAAKGKKYVEERKREAPKEEEEKRGLLLPVWGLVLLIVVPLLIIIGVGVFFVIRLKKSKESQASAEDGKSTKTTPEAVSIPEPEASTKSEASLPKEVNCQRSDQGYKPKKGLSPLPLRSTEILPLRSKEVVGPVKSPPKEENKDGEGGPMRSDKLALKAEERKPPAERSMSSKLVEPVTATEFDYYLSKVSRLVIDYYDDPTQYAVTTKETPGYLFKLMAPAAPEKPADFQEMFKFFSKEVMNSLTHWQHPNFHAFTSAGRSYPDMLAELLASSLGVVSFSWESCPAVNEMEMAMVNWLGRAMGIPEVHLYQKKLDDSVGGGCYFETNSEAVYSSILVARQWKISQLIELEGGKMDSMIVDLEAIHRNCGKLVYYTSRDSHSAMEKGCKMALVRCRFIQAEEQNGWGLTGEQVEAEIVKDLDRGLVPTYIHVTLGTDSTAAQDHLQSIWPVAKKYDLYIHVDAAYAEMFWIDPKHRIMCQGLEHVNSISSCMHRALLHSANATVFFCRDRKLHMKAFAATNKHRVTEVMELRDWGVNQSRRFKALKTWFVMGLYGIHGLKEYVNRICDLGEYFHKLVSKHPNCRVWSKCKLGLFAFQYVEPDMSPEKINEATEALCCFMNESRRAMFSQTKVAGSSLIRLGLWGERGTKTTVDEAWCTMQDLIDEFKQSRNGTLGEAKTTTTPNTEVLPSSMMKK